MGLLDLVRSYFWWFVLVMILISNKSTFIIGLIMAFILAMMDGICPFWVSILLEIVAAVLYLFSLKDIWKHIYEKEIRRLKRKIWKLENH